MRAPVTADAAHSSLGHSFGDTARAAIGRGFFTRPRYFNNHHFSPVLAGWGVTKKLLLVTASAVLLFALPSAVQASVSTDGLLGYWKLDETSAGSFADSSGSGNTGTGQGSGGSNNTPQPSTDVASGFAFDNSRGLNFDGTDDEVDIDISSLGLTEDSAVTVSLWANNLGGNALKGFFNLQTGATGTDQLLTIYFNTDGNNSLIVSHRENATYGARPATNFNDNTWFHLTVTKAAGAAQPTIYINGTANSTGSGNFLGDFGDTTLQLGRGTNTSFYANVLMDDVRLYNRVLSSSEITALAAKTHTSATWDGSASTDWETAGNWNIDAVPDNFTNITVADTSNDPVLSADIETADLTVDSSAALDLAPYGLEFNDAGTFTNNGTLQLQGGNTLTNFANDTDSGTIEYTGSGTYTELIAGDTYNSLTFSGSGSWALDAPLDVNNILSLSAGTFDVSGSNHGVTVGGNWTNTGGTFNEQSGTVTFDGTSGTIDITSGGEAFNNLTLNDGGGGATFELEDALDVNGNLTITGGTLDTKASEDNSINVAGNWTNSDTFTTDGGTVTFDGTNQTIAGTNTFYNLTKTESSNDSTNSTWTFPAGVTTTVTNTWTVDGLDSNDKIALASSSPGTQWNIDPEGTRTIDNATVTDSNNTSGTLINEYADSSVTSGGNNTAWIFSSADPFTWIGGGGVWSIGNGWAGGVAPGSSNTAIFDGAVSNANASATSTVNVGGISIEADYTGTISVTTGTVTVGSSGYTQAGGTFNGSLLTTMDVNGDFTLSGGTFTTSLLDTHTVSGNWNTSGGTYTPSSSGTVTLDGTSGTIDITSGGERFNNLTLNDGGGGATFELEDPLGVDGDLTITGGTLDVKSGEDNQINVGGSWTNSDTFTARAGAVYLDGTGSSNSLSPGGSSFYDLGISGSGTWNATATVTATDAIVISDGVLDLAGNDLSVVSGSAQFLNSGTLRFNGNEASVTTPGNLTSAGTVAYDNSSTVSSPILGATYNNFTVAGSATVQFPSAFEVNGNLTVSSGSLDFNGFNLTLAGNLSNSGTLSNTSGRTLTLDNTSGTQTVDTDGATFTTLAVSGGGGTASLTSNMTVSSAITIAASDTLNVATGIALTSNGAITNNGTISQSGTGKIVDPADSFYIADSSFDEDAAISLGTDDVYLTLTDEDANTTTAADTIAASATVVSCPTDSETVALTETGAASEVFRNSGLTTAAYDGSATNNDGTLECNDGATITATYTDPQDGDDTESDTATATTDTLPTAPSDFAGAADSSTAITWTWTDNANNEDGFKLLDSSDNVIATIATPDTESYQETGLSAATSYTRKIVAYNDAGNSTASGTATESTENGAPTAPSSFAGTALSSTAIRWSWTDNSNDETSWLLQDEGGTTVATITSTTGAGTGSTVTYEETDLTRDTSYTRKVAARNSQGTSSTTSTASVTTLSSQPEVFALHSPANGALVATGLPALSWAKAIDEDDGIDYYRLVLDSTITLQVPRDGASSSSPGAHTHYADGFIAQYFNENDGNESNDTITVTLRTDTTDRFPLRDGAHSWYVTAYDTAGNTRSTSTRTFTVDTVAPLVADFQVNVPVTQRDGTYRINGTTPTLTLTFTDTVQLAEAVLTLEEGTTTLGVLTNYRALQSTTYTLTGTQDTVTATPRAPLTAGGNYRLRITSRDTAGNERATTLLLHVLTAQEAAREEVSELDADVTPTDTIVERLRETLPDSPLSLPDFAAHALLRRQREAVEFSTFLTQLQQSRLAQLFLMNKGIFVRPFLAIQAQWEHLLAFGTRGWLALQQSTGIAVNQLATALGYGIGRVGGLVALLQQTNDAAQTNLHATILASLKRVETAAERIAASNNALIAMPAARVATLTRQWGAWAATTPRIGQTHPENRARTRLTLAVAGEQARTAGDSFARFWQAGKETRIREGLRNRQRLDATLQRVLTPVQQSGRKLATRAWATYEVWFSDEPTTIANVRVTTLTPTSAVIEWDTNHFTRAAAVNYGPTTSYGQKAQVNELANRHRIEIANLLPDTTYYFEIMNQNGDYVYDAYYTLTTPVGEAPLTGTLAPQDARLLEATDVHERPEPNAEVLTALPQGTRLRALVEEGLWISVLLPTGAEGWVLRDTVELLPQAEGPSAAAQHQSAGSE